ncbi:hypothetical protein NSK_004597 [Nannochloropsis salina CCMP1776]|uniref:Uncharacterized protein n=1 Tax=Nannochloropsis salina CCMP1776 TaxID=1027361 RepID=A0A4D9CZU9_9STRA|nr:hypothetical protein NSK_004597 [Nannochloropsis salina CCMP1776]|eukprot:TFJ84124.1 hypothetical protein NSK_004597 [Nannochloropsis salina CCMP1776]
MLASTHGDHSVKLVCYHTRRVLRVLVGHPRTPWTVKFHPRSPRLLASGCIGGQVRIWDAESGHCLHRAALDLPIISLSFHPDTAGTQILAIATFHSIWLWPYQTCARPYNEWQTERLLRCVCFPPPQGRHILVGLSNDTRTAPTMMQRRSVDNESGGERDRGAGPTHAGSPKTFHLFCWDFDAEKAMVPRARRTPMAPMRGRSSRGGEEVGEGSAPPVVMRHLYSSPLGRPRPLLEKAVLYNDGGMDVSACGRFLVTCAQFQRHDLIMGSDSSEAWGGRERAQERGGADGDAWRGRFERDDRRGDGDGLALGPGDVFSLPHLVKLSLLPFLRDEGDEENGDVERERSTRLHRGRREQEAEAGGLVAGVNEDTSEAVPSWYEARIAAVEETDRKWDRKEAREREAEAVSTIGYRYQGQRQGYLAPILAARPLRGVSLGEVTSVKFSPSGSLVVLGYGGARAVLGSRGTGGGHTMVEVYETERMGRVRSVRGGEDEDVNIARFHPIPAHGFVYGTKQGGLCVFATPRGSGPPHTDEG